MNDIDKFIFDYRLKLRKEKEELEILHNNILPLQMSGGPSSFENPQSSDEQHAGRDMEITQGTQSCQNNVTEEKFQSVAPSKEQTSINGTNLANAMPEPRRLIKIGEFSPLNPAFKSASRIDPLNGLGDYEERRRIILERKRNELQKALSEANNSHSELRKNSCHQKDYRKPLNGSYDVMGKENHQFTDSSEFNKSRVDALKWEQECYRRELDNQVREKRMRQKLLDAEENYKCRKEEAECDKRNKNVEKVFREQLIDRTLGKDATYNLPHRIVSPSHLQNYHSSIEEYAVEDVEKYRELQQKLYRIELDKQIEEKRKQRWVQKCREKMEEEKLEQKVRLEEEKLRKEYEEEMARKMSSPIVGANPNSEKIQSDVIRAPVNLKDAKKRVENFTSSRGKAFYDSLKNERNSGDVTKKVTTQMRKTKLAENNKKGAQKCYPVPGEGEGFQYVSFSKGYDYEGWKSMMDKSDNLPPRSVDNENLIQERPMPNIEEDRAEEFREWDEICAGLSVPHESSIGGTLKNADIILDAPYRLAVEYDTNIEKDIRNRRNNIERDTLGGRNNIEKDTLVRRNNIEKDTLVRRDNIERDTLGGSSNIKGDTLGKPNNIERDTPARPPSPVIPAVRTKNILKKSLQQKHIPQLQLVIPNSVSLSENAKQKLYKNAMANLSDIRRSLLITQQRNV